MAETQILAGSYIGMLVDCSGVKAQSSGVKVQNRNYQIVLIKGKKEGRLTLPDQARQYRYQTDGFRTSHRRHHHPRSIFQDLRNEALWD